MNLSTFKRLPDPLAVTFASVSAACLSAVAGIGVGVLVTLVWFNDTRGDAAAAFFIGTIAAGLFASVIAYVPIVCHHHIPLSRTVLVPSVFWLLTAVMLTWLTCKGSYIAADNALWILRSGDGRSYELGWIIRGWAVIITSLIAAFFVGREMLKRRQHQQ
jgi:hypothetical protein